jgi:hypothetical protein
MCGAYAVADAGERVARASAAGTAIVGEATDDGPDEPRHGLLGGLYRTPG